MQPFWWLPDKEAARVEANKNGYTGASQRGYYLTPFWRQWRAQKLSLNPFCELCEQNGISRAAEVVDHIKPVEARASYRQFVEASQLNNLQSLCGPCHRSKTAHQRHGTRKATKAEIKANMKRFED